ncbi:hypothetical protein ACWYXO_12430 [Janthinobacterium aestuarii]
MPFSATVFNVLIASPSDVPAEREAIAASLHEWNALNSVETGKVLLPVMWESHSAPVMGDRPQGIINDQVVHTCDMLIGAFWTRLGSPTGVEDSGTVEEIKWFLKNNKPVMLYYSKAQPDLDAIDTAQLEKLREFKKSIRDKGIQEQYVFVDELKQKLSRQLTIVMRGMSVGTVVNPSVVKEARASGSSPIDTVAEPTKTAPQVPAAESNEPIWFEDYSEKSFAVRGDTLNHREELKRLGGKYIPLKTGGRGWNFSKKRLAEVAELLTVLPELRLA